MKRKLTNGSSDHVSRVRMFGKACVASCQKVLAQIAVAKEAIFAESHQILKSRERLLRLALNEAAAAAWETLYPHLVFPKLATEKAEAVIAWDAHQQSVRRTSPAFALTA